MNEFPHILYHHRTRAFDGQAVHIREMLRALRSLGCRAEEVSLVTQANGELSHERSSRLRRLGLPRIAVELLERGYSAHGRRMLLDRARGDRPDLIYERHALHCRAGLDAARRLGIPFFLEVNSPMVDEMGQLGLLRFPRAARRVEREVLAGADRVFVVTSVLGGIVASLGARPERIVVTPNGADLGAFAKAEERGCQWRSELEANGTLAAGDTLLGFVGFPREWHRLDLVIEAMARLREQKLVFVIIGGGPAVPDLERRASAADLRDRLVVTGPVSRERIPAMVGALDIAVIPAMNPYASPLKLYDSLAAAVPTLAPRQPNLMETVADGQHAVLFEPGSAGALAEGLRDLLDDRAAAAALGQRGRERLSELGLTWTNNALRVVSEWRKLGGRP